MLLSVTIEIISSEKIAAQYATVSFQVFYDELSPYGNWVDYPEYGYVWMPAGYKNFSPYYSNGYWEYADFGWTWISYYPWGWAPFHYGRWIFDPLYGWLWTPDYYWGPAWVMWRMGGGYCGWAPMAPGMSVSFGVVHTIPIEQWVFVDQQYLGAQNISTYYGPRTDNQKIYNNTSVVKNTFEDKPRNTTYVSGPKKEEIEKATGKTITPLVVKESEKPGQKINKNELSMYRPVIKPTAEGKKKPAPAKVVNLKERNPSEKKPEKMEKPKEPEPEKNPPAKKDKLPKGEPPSIPPKQVPSPQPKQEPPVVPPKPTPMPQPKPEKPHMFPKPAPVFPRPERPHRNMEMAPPEIKKK
ncbi:MAG: hypothetical protein HY063_07780 [Bacteroidetes bacterium]|nr:hypothetical protein [Bacteroidota bacterium]